jgi:ribose transport system permease protein
VARQRTHVLGLRLGGDGNLLGLVVLILMLAVAFWSRNPRFLSVFNVHALSKSVAIDGMLGLGMMVVLGTGGLNLALGAIGVAGAMVMGWACQDLGLPAAVAIPMGLLAGAAMGAINGSLIVLTRLHSFMVTLATMSIFFGAMVLLSHTQTFEDLPPAVTAFAGLWVGGVVSPLLFVTIAVALALGAFYRLAPGGRELLATGASPDAAELMGLPVRRWFVVAHMLSGLIAALAAIMESFQNYAVVPSMAGQLGVSWLLIAFLAPVLGGTLLSGGAVSVTGTLLGALLADMMTSGLYMARIGQYWVQSFLGLVLLGVLLLDRLRSVLRARRERGVLRDV